MSYIVKMPKTWPGTNKHLQQCYRIQGQDTESIPIYLQWIIRIWYGKYNTIYISTKIKYLGINPTKYVQGQSKENYKTLMKEDRDDRSKQKDIQCVCMGRSNIVKMSTLPNLIYRFTVVWITTQQVILCISANRL